MSSKLREALDKIGNISAFVAENCGNADTSKYMNDIISIVQAALAEPVLNCDVGTAEEQMERHYIFCSKNRKCRPDSSRCMMCYAKWSQMPYESEACDES